MFDDGADIVTKIKIEHLDLREMTMISYAAFDRRPGTLAPDAMNAMHRLAILPERPSPAGLKVAA